MLHCCCLLILLFLLTAPCGLAQQAGTPCSALGMALPDGKSAWQSFHFPQGGVSNKSAFMAGLAFDSHQYMPFARQRQIGVWTQKGAFQHAAYASYFGNALFGWQIYQLQNGINLGKWRFGGGVSARRMHIAEWHHWHWNMQIGASGKLNAQWHWHLAFEQLRQSSRETQSALGLPPATARLLLEHRLAEVLRLWLAYQQQLQWRADFGLGVQWQMNHRIQLDFAVAPPFRRYSLGLVFVNQNFRLALQARHQALPGLWWGNQLQWSTATPP